MRLYRFLQRVENQIFIIIVLTTLASSLVVFMLMYNVFYTLMFNDIHKRTARVSDYAHREISLDSFSELNTREDNKKEVYRKAQEHLDNIRQIANVRYLFTTKRDSADTIIYLIDGLPLGNEDFRFIGDPVEAEILPQLNRCLDGQRVDVSKILNTEWGPILLTCQPKFDDQNHVVGALVMEYDAEMLYQKNVRTVLSCVIIALAIAAAFIGLASLVLRRISDSFYKRLAYTDALTGLHSRTAFEMDMTSLEYGAKEDIIIVAYDLNRLKRVNDTFGHTAGDNYIRKMGDTIRSMPLNAVSYRTGGDEFVSVVRNTGLDELQTILQECFDRTRYANNDSMFFEFSFGIAAFDPAKDSSLQETLNRADAEMYAFKLAVNQQFRPDPEPYAG